MYSFESHTELASFSRKQVVYRNGKSAKGFYYVESGQIGLYQVTESGKESLLRIYGPGSYFGYRSLFTGQNYPSTARAMLNSEVVKIDVNDFKSLDELAPTLASDLMKEVCYELGEAEKRLMQFNAFSAKNVFSILSRISLKCIRITLGHIEKLLNTAEQISRPLFVIARL
ncbi:cAMP-binding proteins - catabolite gene activator and regulatory subunit of cAMP-dependent protein kinases [Vibrio variabilis]|uniref:cAMP-binding proteins - catabolite gene activator and regulatory subunit of cAMP-dependent protein kinases n=1 Tax=Vibrio variabilis TaxID=990271 RepID=A0ABQ0JQP7_9VIBR|nr:cAMP-binding proteins - catabolite gene activator and regulatory subunit of cAMP-dependent protein kinases [Vibrio variabilis]